MSEPNEPDVPGDLNDEWLSGVVQDEVINSLGLGPGHEGVIDLGGDEL